MRSPLDADAHREPPLSTPALARVAASKATTAPPWGALAHQLPYAVRALRPTQWTKNGLVLLAALFARRMTDLPTLERILLAFFAFSLAASAIYVVNDLADREQDRTHPKKRFRPIASGHLSIRLAGIVAVLCALGAGVFTYALARREPTGAADSFTKWGGSATLFTAAIALYVVLNLAYSGWLKQYVLWDVFVIAAGFVLRALAGAFAASVPISPWFYLTTMFLALVLALGKRRAELVMLSGDATTHRANLRDYTLPLLDQLMSVMVTSTLITYSLYTFQSETSSHALMATIPFVLFGVFRYLYLVYVKARGDQPDELLWRDPQILGAVALCMVTVVGIIYGLPLIQR
ncbi:MAG: UbiA prenyltransferase family protein [Ktedonobacterales bacterium]|nr:UbiA prenyltransferase family protein [Ktedonobacterales bacterium]